MPVSAQPISSLFADLGANAVAFAPSPLSKTGEPAWITVKIPAEATGFVVQGTTSDRNLTGWVRFEDGPWNTLRVVFSATGDTFFAGFHGNEVFSAGRFEVRFKTLASVALVAAGIFDNRTDADREDEEGEKPGAERDAPGKKHPGETGEARQQKTGIIVPPHMHGRGAWKADFFRGNPEALAHPDYLKMAFHHAAGFWAYTHKEGLAQLKAIQDLHQNIRGWSDIGYHFVLDQSGRLYQGRPFLHGETSLASVPALAKGAHVGGHNTGNIGVCMLGCYHPPYLARCTDRLSLPTFDSLAVTFAFLSENYSVSPDNLRGHGQFPGASTSCPGENNLAIFHDLVEHIRTLLVTGNAPLGAAYAERPQEYILTENYPDPFLHTTTIRYYLPQDGIVHLKVFDALGRNVANLAEGPAEGERWYHIPFDATELPSGTYFYRLRVEGFSGTVHNETHSLVHVR